MNFLDKAIGVLAPGGGARPVCVPGWLSGRMKPSHPRVPTG